MVRCDTCGCLFKPAAPGADAQRSRDAVRQRICPDCRRLDHNGKRLVPWDWADALNKSTSRSVAGLHGQEGTWTRRIDADTIRALWYLQHGRCIITNLPMLIPGSKFQLQMHESLDSWAKTWLKPGQDALLPALVRSHRDRDWEPGNVALVVRAAVPLAKLGNNLVAVTNGLRYAQPPMVPTQASIRTARAHNSYYQQQQQERGDNDGEGKENEPSTETTRAADGTQVP